MATTQTVKVPVQCPKCDGFGTNTICAGVEEICDNCGGTGGVQHEYVPYTGRKHVEGEPMVWLGERERALLGPEAQQSELTYQQFLREFPVLRTA